MEDKSKQARLKATAKWMKKTLISFTFRFNKNTEQEIIDKINSQSNKNDYIRQLILKDIRGE